MVFGVPINRLSDSVREEERLKGKIEEKERELVLLSRKLEVSGDSVQDCSCHSKTL